MASLGTLTAYLVADTTKFISGLLRAKGELQAFVAGAPKITRLSQDFENLATTANRTSTAFDRLSTFAVRKLGPIAALVGAYRILTSATEGMMRYAEATDKTTSGTYLFAKSLNAILAPVTRTQKVIEETTDRHIRLAKIMKEVEALQRPYTVIPKVEPVYPAQPTPEQEAGESSHDYIRRIMALGEERRRRQAPRPPLQLGANPLAMRARQTPIESGYRPEWTGKMLAEAVEAGKGGSPLPMLRARISNLIEGGIRGAVGGLMPQGAGGGMLPGALQRGTSAEYSARMQAQYRLMDTSARSTAKNTADTVRAVQEVGAILKQGAASSFTFGLSW